MSSLLNTCAVCGAEESLDALLQRMIDDDEVRRLIAQVISHSLPLGSMVVRYLRLHKPAKQKLRMSKAAQLLAELVPDMVRGAVTRKGRDWPAHNDGWKAALQAVFDAHDKGALQLPLEGNAYLYEVLLRLADKAEAAAERDREATRRNRSQAGPRDPGAPSVGALVAASLNGPAAGEPRPPVPPPLPAGPSRRALQLQAEIAQARAAREGSPTADDPS